jgi:hypothetical protein
VNGWGFMRITHGSDFGSYYHEVRRAHLFLHRLSVLLLSKHTCEHKTGRSGK